MPEVSYWIVFILVPLYNSFFFTLYSNILVQKLTKDLNIVNNINMLKNLVLFLVLFIILPVNAQTLLTGEVTYDVNSAREELLNTSPKKLNPHMVAKHLTDSENRENLGYALQGNVELQDRTLAFFSDGTYAVMYDRDKYHVWYYSHEGKLIYAEEKDGIEYPYKSYKYTTMGELVNMGLRVSKEETFIYSPNGRLIAHWLQGNAYDEDGNIIMQRKYAK